MHWFRRQAEVEEKREVQTVVDYKSLNQDEIKKLENELIQLAKKYMNNPDWEQFEDQQCDMYSLFFEGRLATKGEKVLEFSLEAIAQFLKDPNSFKKTDVMMQQVKVLEQGQGYQIGYIKFKGIWPVAARDLIIYGIRKQIQDTYYCVSKSVAYNYQSPQGIVRAQCYIGAYILKRLSKTSTRVTYISDADVKGMIPGMIKNMVSKYQASVPINLNKRLTRLAQKREDEEIPCQKQKVEESTIPQVE